MSWYAISINLRWPHEGIIVGYEYIAPDEFEDYNSIRIHLFLVSILFDFS
jgi:hypothetical protein